MKAPFWRRALSYMLELHVESTSSEYNPNLHVSLSKGRYQLSTANAVYSFADLYDNFSSAFELVDLDALSIKKVLILGFGLGSIPIILEKMDKQYKYTAVEIDEEVVYLATKYAVPDIHSPLEIICTDAKVFIDQNQLTYDLITVDLFLDDIIPEHFQKRKFLQQIKETLSPNGLLLYNRLNYTEADTEANKVFFENEFKPVFPKGKFLEVKGNWMLCNY